MVAITQRPTTFVLPTNKRQVTDRSPQTHLPTSQKLPFWGRLCINVCSDPLTEQLTFIPFVFEKLIWCIPSSWAGWAGPDLTILFSLYFCNKQMASIPFVLKKNVEHFVCFTKVNLVHSVWLCWLGWACSHYLVSTRFSKMIKWREWRLFFKN